MQIPIRRTHRPRITLGQTAAAVAVAAVPMGPLMRLARRVDDLGSAAVLGTLVLGLVALAELVFWAILVAQVEPLRRLLGMPRWVEREVIVDPRGVHWVEDVDI